MRKSAIAGGFVSLALLAGIGAPMIASAASAPAANVKEACVQRGPKGGTNATGNVVLWNWNKSTCPANTYAVSWNSATATATPAPAPTETTKDLGGNASVPTGGSFSSSATLVGTITLPAGTYEVALAAKATPLTASSAQIFPVFSVYNQVRNSAFTGNLFNVGSGGLEYGANTNIDSYFNGQGIVTLTASTALYFYAFGYDSDRGQSAYNLDDLIVTATQVTPAS
jgi:hypothetical protein